MNSERSGFDYDVKDDVIDMTEVDGQAAAPIEVTGTVKWFDPVKGFGFVVSDDGGSDILLHVNVLRNFGQSSVADGARITLVAQKTERGVQAVSIVSITPLEGLVASLPDIVEMDREEIARAPILPARIKWFDKGKGFGFANVFGRSEDVFVHIDVLRQSGLSDLSPGEAIALRVIDGKRGRMAAEVRAWETVILTEDCFSEE